MTLKQIWLSQLFVLALNINMFYNKKKQKWAFMEGARVRQ